jgi:hypothetical protein
MKYTADNFRKVTITAGQATHVTNPEREDHTLCGRRWWFQCHIGTDHYCRTCQRILSKIYKPE